ncbi:MAG: hypothetical protein IM509_05465 [Microcystis sp. M31BS1]|jgi:predicted nucleic-acid-binding Zn-ribbon protein|nr:hypothetical protein [Microcystis sp. M31BS1]
MIGSEYVTWSIACLTCGFTGEHSVRGTDGLPKVDKCRCPKCSNSAYVLRPLRERFVIEALCKEVVKLKLDLMDLQSMGEQMEELRVLVYNLRGKE